VKLRDGRIVIGLGKHPATATGTLHVPFDPELVDWLSASDLIVHETNLGPAHTDYASLAALPADLRGRMRLIHYPDDFDSEKRNISLCREGDVYAV